MADQRPMPQNEARRRVGRVAVTWMGLSLGGTATVGALVIWHLVRRGRLIREGLGPPRAVSLHEPEKRQREPEPAPSETAPP